MSLMPLASGFAVPLPDGRWRCHSLFSRAINLQHDDGTLLTLLRGGTDVPPMGWLLRSPQFERLRNILFPGAELTMTAGTLYWRALHLLPPRRILAAALPGCPLMPLAPFLSPYPHPTGLSGSLSLAVSQPDDAQRQLLALLNAQFNGIERHIGLGPGLTPSMDDMLVGALAVLHNARPFREASRKTLPFPPLTTLRMLTTTVSACYLHHASQGRFSTTLIHLFRHLAEGAERTRTHLAIRQLLAHGHTSGADTLLGVHVAQQWLETHFPGAGCYDGP